MCEFCHRHGDGRKWYLQARNYSADMLSDARRRRIVREVLLSPASLIGSLRKLDRLEHAPAPVQRAVKGLATKRMKRDHFGQVVPLEDVAAIFELVNSIVQVPCVCRYASSHREVGYCYGITLDGSREWAELFGEESKPPGEGPDFSDVQPVSASEALEQIRGYEKDGLCHTVWTFGTPFIGGLCNCDRVDCLAMQATVQRGVQAFFRAEYVAEIDPEVCTGCRSCMRLCQFGALGYSALSEKASVDQRACYGCGVCRAACSRDAIGLRPRAEVPAAERLW
jgi:Pyruvate/2-oxoacid:ferredoxin oxidoreductase delta subunit